MRLITKTLFGNIHEAAESINKVKGSTQFLMSITPVTPKTCVALFRVDSYPSYKYFCEQWGYVPISIEEYFK